MVTAALVLLAFVAGLAVGWYLPRPVAAAPVTANLHGCAPKGGTAVMVDRDGVEVSRRHLTEARDVIIRYHGKQPIETFRYAGRLPNGDYEFRMGA
jgi:hypothetical protein